MVKLDRTHEFGLITDKISEFYDRHDIEVTVTVEHRVMNHYEATATYQDKRLGTVKAHYTILLVAGQVVFQ